MNIEKIWAPVGWGSFLFTLDTKETYALFFYLEWKYRVISILFDIQYVLAYLI